jgi:hypothetical protein
MISTTCPAGKAQTRSPARQSSQWDGPEMSLAMAVLPNKACSINVQLSHYRTARFLHPR